MSVLLGGCPPGLDFVVVGDDAAGRDAAMDAPGRDAPGSDAPGFDAPRTDGPVRDAGTACPLPHLLVALAYRSGATGHVARLSLGPDGSAARCTDLTGTMDVPTDALPQHPFTAAGIDEGHVLVGADSYVAMIDPRTNRVLWRHDIGRGRAIDAARVEGPTGEALALVGIDRLLASGFEVRDVFVYRPDVPEPLHRWALNADPLLLGLGIGAVSASPDDRRALLALRAAGSDSHAAVGAPLPYDGLPVSGVEVQPYPRDVSLQTFHAFHDGAQARLVWVGKPAAEPDEAVYYRNGSLAGFLGPSRCGPSDCRSPLDLRHAVADPSLNTRLIAVCEDGGTRRVVRFRTSGGECEELLGPADIGADALVERLGLALP